MTVTSPKVRASPQAETLPSTDTTDFESIFLEYWPRVYSVLLQLVGDQAEAEDLALETFWRLYDRPPQNQESLNLGGWLYRVATNLGLNALRSRKRRKQYELEAGKWDVEERSDADPAEALIRAEERRRVRRVLSGMDRRQAQLLLLRHSGLTYKALAAVLSVSANSIGTLLVRAEREFEKRYRKLEFHD